MSQPVIEGVIEVKSSTIGQVPAGAMAAVFARDGELVAGSPAGDVWLTVPRDGWRARVDVVDVPKKSRPFLAGLVGIVSIVVGLLFAWPFLLGVLAFLIRTESVERAFQVSVDAGSGEFVGRYADPAGPSIT